MHSPSCASGGLCRDGRVQSARHGNTQMFHSHDGESTMSEPHTPPEGAPPADAVKEHVKQTHEETNLGAGDEEPDPATAEDPPSQTSAGDKKRDTEGAPDTAAEAGVGGPD